MSPDQPLAIVKPTILPPHYTDSSVRNLRTLVICDILVFTEITVLFPQIKCGEVDTF